MKVHVWIILLFFSSIAYAEEDIRWKDADEKMQEQQYEEAAKLYKELSHKSDTVYEEINSRGVKDMRKIYSIDELELANSQQQNRHHPSVFYCHCHRLRCIFKKTTQKANTIATEASAGTRGGREIHAK